jgi:hypothetical protein
MSESLLSLLELLLLTEQTGNAMLPAAAAKATAKEEVLLFN